jgi:hypothetical protein
VNDCEIIFKDKNIDDSVTVIGGWQNCKHVSVQATLLPLHQEVTTGIAVSVTCEQYLQEYHKSPGY